RGVVEGGGGGGGSRGECAAPPICRANWASWLWETSERPARATQTCCAARQSVSVLALAWAGTSKSAASTPSPRPRSLFIPWTSCCPILEPLRDTASLYAALL